MCSTVVELRACPVGVVAVYHRFSRISPKIADRFRARLRLSPSGASENGCGARRTRIAGRNHSEVCELGYTHAVRGRLHNSPNEMSTRLIMPISKETLRTRPLQIQHKNLKKARRVLFGRPNPEETLQFWTKELQQHQKAASEKYSFDFEAGLPIISPTANYVYTSCEIVKAPVKKRPEYEDPDDSEPAYFKPEDVILSCLRDDRNWNEIKHEAEREPLKEKKQTCITDFMPQRKRNVSMVGEKSDPVRVPTKIAKFDTKS